MTVENILDAIGAINDEAVQDARAYKRSQYNKVLKWGTMVACLGVILTVSMLTLPNILRGPGGVLPPPNPNPGSVVGNGDDRSDYEPTLPPSEKSIIINWDNVAVNESADMSPDAAPLYRDPALYEKEIWSQKEIAEYYGRELNVPYIPDGLTSGGQTVTATIYREKSSGKVVQDQVGRGFWVDFWEDGSPKSDDDIVISKGFTIAISKLGILRCGLLPVDEEHTTNFGSVPVTLKHCSMPYGFYDPTTKALDGLSNMPAGYYDIYTASFILDGVEYEIMAQRLELEEVIKITASIINMPYNENFAVGNVQALPNKDSEPTEYPNTVVVPGFDLDEPDEPVNS